MLTSPCIGCCQIGDKTGLCVGCARTRDEIGAWRAADEDFRQRVWSTLPERRAALGIRLHRLNLTAEALRDFVAGSFRRGVWSVGVPDAVAAFRPGDVEAVEVQREGGAIRCRSSEGALAFDIDTSVRAFAVGDRGGGEILVLATPRGAVSGEPTSVLSPLGPDKQAVREQDRAGLLYDFGLKRVGARFCIRTVEPALAAHLDSLAGRDWADVLPLVRDELLRASPHRVVLTPIGRIEVFSPIPPSDAVSPDGPHTHFLPTFLEEGRETPAGIATPQAYVACALFHPRVLGSLCV